MIATDPLRQLLRRPPHPHIDLEPLTQQIDARIGDLLGDEDPVLLAEQAHAAARTPASRNTRWAAPTPAPWSTSWPSWLSAISRPESEVRMSNAPK